MWLASFYSGCNAKKTSHHFVAAWKTQMEYFWDSSQRCVKKTALRKLLHLEDLRKSFTGAAVLYLPRSFLNGGLLLGMVTLVPWKRQLFAHGETFRYDNVWYDEILACQKGIKPHILSLFLQKMRHRYILHTDIFKKRDLAWSIFRSALWFLRTKHHKNQCEGNLKMLTQLKHIEKSH